MVDRMDFSKSVASTDLIKERVRQGQSIIIFPEGTFYYATGLRPFKLGAFIISVETETPICPISIRGTRQILREGSRLAKPKSIKVGIGKPIIPKGKDWNEISRLLSLTRAEIAEHCGEAPIDSVVAGLEIKPSPEE